LFAIGNINEGEISAWLLSFWIRFPVFITCDWIGKFLEYLIINAIIDAACLEVLTRLATVFKEC